MKPIDIKKAEKYLADKDARLAVLIDNQKLDIQPPRTNYFASLSRSIVGQQVSVAAASAIYGRLDAATGMDPRRIVGLSEENIKAIGLSKQKAGYILDLARHFLDDPKVYNHLEQQSDEEVIKELVAVKGIGIWTAQMFLIFTLARPDVFAPDDIGLIRAVERLYDLENVTKAKLIEISEKWRPYRTVASYHLWQSLKNTPA